MGAPAEIPHADEDLKSLVVRFKEAPGSAAFAELSAALLVRGHATEALRVAEHGLQIHPDNVDGRIERAAALLALGRPRVAYVELKRALAINPSNRRAMRLLGKVFVEVGAPSRAAELLAQRFKSHGLETQEQEPTHVTHAPISLPERGERAERGERPSLEGGRSGAVDEDGLAMRADTEPLRRRGNEAPTLEQFEIPRGGATFESESTAPERQALRSALELAASAVTARGAASQPSRQLTESGGLRARENSHPTQTDALEPSPPLTPDDAAPGADGAFPDLFKDLTRDLGLGAPSSERPQNRVEVTQVIRRRIVTRREEAELSTIDGPIVDTTQPGRIQESAIEAPVQPIGTSEPPPMFDQATAPRLQVSPFSIDDEPLFQEHMPFAVRPVDGPQEAPAPDASGDMRETIDETAPPELEVSLMDEISGPEPGLNETSGEDTPVEPAPAPAGARSWSNERDAELEAPRRADGPKVPVGPPADLNPRMSTADLLQAGMPLLELSRSGRGRALLNRKLEIVTPPASRTDVVYAATAALVMMVWLAFLFWKTPTEWRGAFPFLDDAPATSQHHAQAKETSPGAVQVDRPQGPEAPRPSAHSSE